MSTFPATLKWNKQVFRFDLDVTERFTGRDMKEHIHALTKVPVERQKLMLASKPKLWKGMLQDDEPLGELLQKNKPINLLQLTMMGSVQVLPEPTAAQQKKTTAFIEDWTPEQRRLWQEQEYQSALETCTGMIPALQVLPQHRQDDSNKAPDQVREYNRLVHGLPQWQIEKLIQQQSDTTTTTTTTTTTIRLTGTCVMTLGLELQRAYVNDLAVLQDGTLVSALQDGHVQLWKHGERIRDVIHPGRGNSNNSDHGVENVLALQYPTHDADDMPAFCTAGRGVVQLWNTEADPIVAVSSTPLPYASPAGMVQLALPNVGTFFLGVAARFHVTPPSQINTSRLVPQDETGRQRLAHIQAQEAMVEHSMENIRKSVQMWYHIGGNGHQRAPSLQSKIIQASAPVTALESWNAGSHTILAAGDNQGGIQLWKVSTHQDQVQVNKIQHYQLVTDNVSQSAIECIKYLPGAARGDAGQLIVSTNDKQPAPPIIPLEVASKLISVSVQRAVHVLKVENDNSPSISLQMTLNGHKDVVSCVLPLPNGDVITAGGKLDATIKVWSQSQLSKVGASKSPILTEAAIDNLCTDVGYVFALTVLEDFKTDEKNPSQKHFAIATARYNVVKIII
jgi:WD40 repeat protein